METEVRRGGVLDSGKGGWQTRLSSIIEAAAGALVAAEIVILFSGVAARYVFHQPLVWSDELASILFPWLAMLGAAAAFQRNEHMRMTALVSRAGPRLRVFLEGLALAAALAFLLLMLRPSFERALAELPVITPALEISNLWRAAAVPVGMALMILAGAMRLERARRESGVWAILLPVAVVTVAVASFALFGSSFRGLGSTNLLIFFVGVTSVCVLAGAPIAFAFGLATFGYVALAARAPVTVVAGRMDEGMSHLILLSVPMFVFLGRLIEATGMAQAMVRFLASLLGHVRGGLYYVLIGAMYLVSGISGAKAADMAAVAPVLFPEMKARGARPGELAALLAATGAQTETIPPSLVLITISSVTGVSIAALFAGGLAPGAVMALMLCLVVWRRCGAADSERPRRAAGGEILRAGLAAAPALALPVLIRAAVTGGVATATEVSTIGVAYTAIVGLVIYRRLPLGRLMPMLVDSAVLSGAILFIIGAATGMSWALTQSGFARQLATFMAQLPGGYYGFLAVSVVAFVILGSVLEGIPAIVLFGPLLFPIARAAGVHEVHYAMVVILAMGLGLFAPPFGIGYYAACAIGEVNPDDGIRPIWGYLAALAAGLALVAAVPWISVGFL